MALSVFLLEQVAWAFSDRDRAVEEVRRAKKCDREQPESAPLFVGQRGSVVATLAEALKAERSAAIEGIFGDWRFIEDAFRKRIAPPSVWLDVRHLSPLDIYFLLDGVPQSDPSALRALARSICVERWQPLPLWFEADPVSSRATA